MIPQGLGCMLYLDYSFHMNAIYFGLISYTYIPTNLILMEIIFSFHCCHLQRNRMEHENILMEHNELVLGKERRVKTCEQRRDLLLALNKLIDCPEEFRCPLSGRIMKDPVMVSSGVVRFLFFILDAGKMYKFALMFLVLIVFVAQTYYV